MLYQHIDKVIRHGRRAARRQGYFFCHEYLVNWLRHEHTDYDLHPYTTRSFIAAQEKIATAFPVLRDECDRQIEMRQGANCQPCSNT